MCDSDPYDMCNSGCKEFECEHNPGFTGDPPHRNLKKLFGHDRYIIGFRSDKSIEIYPMIWTYSQAVAIKDMLKDVKNIDIVILSEWS